MTKISKSHHSLNRDLKREVEWLMAESGVKNIALGRFDNCRHKHTPGTLSFVRKTESGFQLRAYAGDGLQELYVYIEPIDRREAILERIQERYEDFRDAHKK